LGKRSRAAANNKVTPHQQQALGTLDQFK